MQKELDIKDTGCFADIFSKAKEYLATDIFILEKRLPRLGRLKSYCPIKDGRETTREEIEGLIRITSPLPGNGDGGEAAPLKGFSVNKEYAFAIKEHGRYRVSATRSQEGLGLSIRKLPYFIPPLKTVDRLDFLKGLSEVFEGKATKGLILHTGLTGAGKSTSIASEVDKIAQNVSGNILTFEAPIEYHYTPTMALIRQYEVGHDVESYIDGMKLALRNDPSVVVIGEVRTHEEIRTMVDIAMRGQIVFATLHTSNAMDTLRFLDSISENKESWRQLIAYSLRAIISQKLMYTIDQGFVFIPEILIPNNVVRQKIAAGDFAGIKELFLSSHELRQNGSSTFEQTLNALCKEKIISDYHKSALISETSMV
jgi:twitching motility protein PilT